ncbi:MAG: (d)CMP kinase [Oscillospiraceae bacterium]|nr:(d)CMP kinase [Oscillospiraceae bacterium]
MINIAIDGPAGAGKSTISRYAAQKLGLIYVDTGALYRAIGLFALQRGGDAYNRDLIVGLLPSIDVDLRHVNGEQRVYLCGENVTQIIRTPEVSLAASAVAEVTAVRNHLFNLQLEIARKNDVIMDGRDIGTVILPHATLKIFLTASAEERARRRHNELLERGQDVDYDDVLSDVITRDHADSSRAIAPLRPAHDAVIVDTTGLNFEEAADKVISLIRQRTGLR